MGELIGAFALGMGFALSVREAFAEPHDGVTSTLFAIVFPVLALAGLVILLVQRHRRNRTPKSS